VIEKCRKALLFSLFVFGCIGIIKALVDGSQQIGVRIFCACLGVMLCVAATVSSVRWALIAIFTFLLGLTGVPHIFADSGNIDVTSLLLTIACLGVAIYFGRKAFPCFKFNRAWSTPETAAGHIDSMSGLEFEVYTAQLLKKLGYTDVTVTKASGDQGIDVIAKKDGIRYAIQCKNYSNKLDNTPVQEVYAGKAFYGCDIGVVVTNSTFTQGARELANSIGVLLWDREVLGDMIRRAGKKHRRKRKVVRDTSIGERSEFVRQISASDATDIEDLLNNLSAGFTDDLFPAAVDVILGTAQVSVSVIQRHLKLGYARAARIVDEMEEKGIVGPFQGSKPRDILITPSQWECVKSRLPSLPCCEPERKHNGVDPEFIAQTQWYATRSGPDLVDGE
jgi:predicted RecB family endonuclease